jgi:hypothetical protein
MSSVTAGVEALYQVRKGVVDLVDVPKLCYLAIDGSGGPDGAEFADAVQALYAISYGARFLLKKAHGEAPKVRPLEALWWVDDPAQQEIFEGVARGEVEIPRTDREGWRWRAMIMQPDPIGADMIDQAVAQARAKKPPKASPAALDRHRYELWEEGRCAQLLHVGPYAAEGASIARLHEGIAAAGYRPTGRHHEIYLGDPRRSAPERLRTILRHPVTPA